MLRLLYVLHVGYGHRIHYRFLCKNRFPARKPVGNANSYLFRRNNLGLQYVRRPDRCRFCRCRAVLLYDGRSFHSHAVSDHKRTYLHAGRNHFQPDLFEIHNSRAHYRLLHYYRYVPGYHGKHGCHHPVYLPHGYGPRFRIRMVRGPRWRQQSNMKH